MLRYLPVYDEHGYILCRRLFDVDEQTARQSLELELAISELRKILSGSVPQNVQPTVSTEVKP